MESTTFEKVKPSRLGFGCMRFPVSNPGTPEECINEEEASGLLRTAYENGVTYFDTAYFYHNGTSQEFSARVLRSYPRDSYLLANKLPLVYLKEESDVKKFFEEQASVCKVDYFDYYLLHALGDKRWESVVKPFKVYDKLLKYKEEGRIHKLGFSFHGTNACLRDAVKTFKWDFVQIQLNYFDWYYQDARTKYQILRDAGIPIVVMEPVRGGALARLCPEALEIIRDSGYEGSSASLALRYVASLEGVQTVLSGMSAAEQVADNLKTFRNFKPLSEDEKALVEKVRLAYLKGNSIPCTSCQYCQPCPNGVSIPKIFAAYNSYAEKQDLDGFRKSYLALAEEEKPENCIDCGQCVKACPQGIGIPEKLKMVKGFATHQI